MSVIAQSPNSFAQENVRATSQSAVFAASVSASAQTQACPFDDGQASLAREGLVLTRYALGLTGSALVNDTGFALSDETSIASTINCPSCGLDINGNGGFDSVDATIISRKLAGYSGAALTNGLALGSGTRNSASAVQSFLTSGCGTTPAVVRTGYLNANIGPANTGQYSSIAIGADGLPLIAFYDQTNADLKVAKCATIDCATSTISTIDSVGDVGRFPSLAIGSNGFGVISYYDLTNGALKLALCTNAACSSASLVPIDGTNNSGQFSSLVLDAGKPRIAYYDATTRDLKYAKCNNVTCDAAQVTIESVTTIGNVGEWSALTLVNPAKAFIAYWDASTNEVKVAACSGPFTSCSTSTISVIESLPAGQVAEGIAVTTGRNGFAIMSYHVKGTASSRIVACGNASCSTSTIHLAGATAQAAAAGSYSSISIGPDGLPLVAFSGAALGATCESSTSAGNSNNFVKCLTHNCSERVGYQSEEFAMISFSVTHGIDGKPIMSGRRCGVSNTQLMSIHCAGPTCQSEFAPR